MDIFTTTYKEQYMMTMRSIQFELLLKLAGNNAHKFECFRPVISGHPLQQTEQYRKAKFVNLLIQLIQSGVNFDDIPTGCSCEEIVGNICTVSSDGYAKLIAGIQAIAD